MLLPLYTLVLPTPFGEAHFSIELTDAGRVERVGVPLAGLPESVVKLTYGKGWRDAVTYFERLAATLPFRIEAVLFGTQAPRELDSLVRYFRQHSKSATPPTAYASYWRDHSQWTGVFGFRQQQVDGVLKRLLRVEKEALRQLGSHLMPYLLSLLPLEFTRTSELSYRLVGAFGTAEARDYLLGQLEREGRHPFATDILKGLEHYRDEDTAGRLIRSYANDSFGGEQLEVYIRGLPRFPAALVGNHMEQLLRVETALVSEVITALRQLAYDDERLERLLVEQFVREGEYYKVHDLLRELLRFPGPLRIDLASLNEKLALPAFVDLPPVNWPQQLESGWRGLIERTDRAQVLRVVEEYLARPAPRLQRNAVLQLRALQAQTEEALVLSPATEARLRELLASRYDKVYVEVMNVLGHDPAPLLHDPEAMLDALMAVSLGNTYRFVILNALRRVGRSPALKQRARTYYTNRLPELRTAGRLPELRALLPYLEKYLGKVDDLRAAAGQRAAG